MTVKIGDMRLEKNLEVSTLQQSPRNSSTSSFSSYNLEIGQDVKIIKKGTQKGKMCSVIDPDWGGKVKVRMHISGNIKSYEHYELRGLKRKESRGVWSKRPTRASPRPTVRYERPETVMKEPFHMWKAPERVDIHEFNDVHVHESAADVYSMGIILSELYSLNPPWMYEDQNDEASLQIVRDALLRGMRPNLTIDSKAPHGFYHLITRCWRHDPSHRPRASCVLRRLREISECHHYGHNLHEKHCRKLRTHHYLRRRIGGGAASRRKMFHTPRSHRSNADMLMELVSFATTTNNEE